MSSSDQPTGYDAVKAMFKFLDVVRVKWLKRLTLLHSELAERDFLFLEWLYALSQAPFSMATDYYRQIPASGGKSDGAISQTLAWLKKDLGLIDSSRTKSDDRKKIIAISQKGKSLIDAYHKAKELFEQQVADCLGPDIESAREPLLRMLSAFPPSFEPTKPQ